MPTTFNTDSPRPAYVYDSTDDAWYPLAGVAPASSVDRYYFTATSGATSISGVDNNGATLAYTAGSEQVYLNGVLLVRTDDYTATNGTSITGLAALATNDIVEVITFNPSNIEKTSAILSTAINAKGDLIAGTADNTAGILTAGTNGYILSTNSSTATGLEWIANDQGDLTAVSSGTGITVTNGTGPIPSVAVDTTLVATTSNTMTMTNKTLTSPTLTGTITASGATITDAILRGSEEDINIVASAATGTINFDVSTASVWYYTSNAGANHTLNFRYSSSTSLNSILATGDAITLVWLNTNGGTAYYPNTIQIDGTTVTPKVPSAISSGNTSAIDAYSFTIIKTASATFTVLETQTKFA
jgi:hypothetical protein